MNISDHILGKQGSVDTPKRKHEDLPELEPDEIDLDPQLSRALGFSYRDLLANRGGYMTKEQQERLYHAPMSVFLLSAAVLCILIAVGNGLIGIVMAGRGYPVAAVAFCLVGVAVFGLALPAMGGRTFSRWFAAQSDLSKGAVEAVEGEARRIVRGGKYPARLLLVQGVTFPASDRVLAAFRLGEPYRVYYAPHSKKILSAEPLKAKRGV